MNILTFDIEDWYNCDFISEDFAWDKFDYLVDKAFLPVLDEMDRRGLKSTCFCLGWLAEKHPDLIREIARRGHQIGCHSYQHELAFRFTREQFVADMWRYFVLPVFQSRNGIPGRLIAWWRWVSSMIVPCSRLRMITAECLITGHPNLQFL